MSNTNQIDVSKLIITKEYMKDKLIELNKILFEDAKFNFNNVSDEKTKQEICSKYRYLIENVASEYLKDFYPKNTIEEIARFILVDFL